MDELKLAHIFDNERIKFMFQSYLLAFEPEGLKNFKFLADVHKFREDYFKPGNDSSRVTFQISF